MQFPKNYSKATVPPQNKVNLFFKGINIVEIDLRSQAIVLTFQYTILWYDNRIKIIDGVDFVPVSEEMKNFWIPNLIIQNQIAAHSYSVVGDRILFGALKRKKGTQMMYSCLSKIEVACAMDYQFFPFDYQNCSVLVKQNFIKEFKYI